MVTVVTKTIGPTGRDYSTFTLAEAAVQSIATAEFGGTNLVTADGAIVFEADAGTYNQHVIINSTLTTDATRNVTFTVAAGSEHGGSSDSGVILASPGSPAPLIIVSSPPHTVLRGLVALNGDGTGSVTNNYGVWVQPDAYGSRVEQCIIKADGLFGVFVEPPTTFDTTTALPAAVIKNNLIKVTSSADRRALELRGSSSNDSYTEAVNNTLICGDEAIGINVGTIGGAGTTGSYELTNNLVLGSGAHKTYSQGGSGTHAISGSNNFGSSYWPFAAAQQALSQTWTFTTDTGAASTGSQVIYDASTGVMVNAPGNDAIGAGTTTGAPTTDINGEDRIRGAYADPGAFTTQLRTITNSIDGAGGGDYTTFTAAEAAVATIPSGTNLVQRNEAIVFEADAGTYSENFTISSSLTCDPTRNVTYQSAAGGQAVVGNAAPSAVIKITEGAFTTLRRLTIDSTGTSTSTRGVEVFPASGKTCEGCVFDSLTIQNLTNVNFNAIELQLESSAAAGGAGSAAHPTVIQNCVELGAGNGFSIVGGKTDEVHARVVNCTLAGSSYSAISINTANDVTIDAVNNISLNHKWDWRTVYTTGAVTATGSNNFGGGANPFPAALQGSPYPITASTAYDPGAGDFALYVGKNGALLDSPNNDVIDGGVGPDTDASVPTTDILGNTRSGTTTNPGAFALAQATAVLTRTIGPVGRDYATFTAAEADVANIGGSADLVFENERIEFEADAATYSESVTFQSSLTTDATRQVTYKPAAGSEHGGVPGNGVVINSASINFYRDSFMLFEGLEVNGSSTQTFNIGSCTGTVTRNCIINATTQGFVFGNSAQTAEISNCVINSGNYSFLLECSSGAQSVALYNNTILDGPSGLVAIRVLQSGTGTISLDAVNNLTLNAAGVYAASGTVSVTGSNNFGGTNQPFPAALQALSQTWTTTTDTGAASTGSQVIYDATTGAMVNAPGNDAVGVGTTTGAPTTDINGEERIRGTFADPGAFTTELRTITKSIDGAGGGDYTTFTAAEAAVSAIPTDANLVQRNEAIVFEADAGTYNEAATINFISTLTTDPTRNVTYKPAAGSEHGGSEGSGVRIVSTAYTTVNVRDDNIAFEGLVIANTSAFYAHNVVGLGGWDLQGQRLTNCIIACSDSNSGYGVQCYRNAGSGFLGTASNPVVVSNCVFLRVGIHAVPLGSPGSAGTIADNLVFTNCTFLSKRAAASSTQAFGIYDTNGTLNIKVVNCLNVGLDNDFSQGTSTLTVTTTGSAGNFGVQSSATWQFPGKGSPYPITATTSFSTPLGSGDYAVFMGSNGSLANVTGNDVWQQGVGPGTNSDVPITDINGVARSGATANPGAFEADGFVAPTVTTQTIGPVGRDFATFTLAEASLPSEDITFTNRAFVFEADAATYVEILNVDSTLVSDATRNVTYRCADRADRPVIGNGTQSTTVRMRDDFTHFDGIDSFDTSGGAFKLFDSQVGLVIENCEATSDGPGVYLAKSGANIGSAAAPCIVRNVVTKARFGVNASGADLFVEVVNCTFLPGTTSPAGQVNYQFLATGSSACKLFNCIVLDSRADRQFQATATVTGNNNIGVTGGVSVRLFSTNGLGSEKTPSTNTSPGAGDWAIFDATTGALINVPDNDVVGEGTATGAPTTDINGEDRIRGTHADPGAFTTDLRTITKSIDAAGGGDYTTFTAAEADVSTLPTDTDMVKRNEAIVFEAEAGTYSEVVMVDSTLTADATRNVTYRPASGSEHGGVFGAGVRLHDNSSNYGAALQVRDNFTVFDGLEVHVSNTSGFRTGFALSLTHDLLGVKLRNMLLWSQTQRAPLSGGATGDFNTGSASAPIVFENLLIRKTDNFADMCSVGARPGKEAHYVISNCTFIGDSAANHRAFAVGAPATSTSNYQITNCMSFVPWQWYQSVSGTMNLSGSNNFGGATNPLPVAIQGSPYPITATTNTSPGAGNWAIYDASNGALINVPGNSVIGEGTATGVPATDINGEDRIRDTHVDPGAFTTQLRTITRSIDAAGGGDYTTFTAAEAAVTSLVTDADMVKRNEAILFEADAGDYSENFSFFTNNGITCDPTRNVTWTHASGAGHGGQFGSGANIVGGCAVSESFAVVDGLSVSPSTGSAASVGLGADGVILRNLMSHSTNNRAFQLSRGGTAANPNVVENCVGKSDTLRTFDIRSDGAESHWRVINCTAMATGNNQGFIVGSSSSDPLYLELINNLVSGGTGRSYYQVPGSYTLSLTGSSNVGPGQASAFFPAAVQAESQTWTTTTDPLAAATGSQVIYDATTGALVNVPGNDAVGVGTAAEVPTTDINGEDRIRLTYADPGAFTTDLRTITRTVDTNGVADYTSMITLEASLVSDMPEPAKRNEALVYEFAAGNHDTNPTGSSFNIQTHTTTEWTAKNNITWRPQAGAEHGGDFSQGAKIYAADPTLNASTSHANVDVRFLTFDGLVLGVGRRQTAGWEQVLSSRNVPATYRNLLIEAPLELASSGWDGLSEETLVVENCVVKVDNSNALQSGIKATTYGVGGIRAIVRNCVVLGVDSTANALVVEGATAGRDKHVSFYNNLAASGKVGVTFHSINHQSQFFGSNNYAAQAATYSGNSSSYGNLGFNQWTFSTNVADTSTGSQVIYDSSTGAMVNVPGNDAVGVGTATEAPTTDINGDDRIRGAYADPGAFTTELITFTKTIGATGRDYSTFTAAEADVQNIPTDLNLQQRNEAIVFEADAGTYSESVSFSSSLTTDATRQVTYKPAAGSEHGGVFGAGVHISSTGTAGTNYDDFTRFEALSFVGSVVTFAVQAGIGWTVTGCLIHSTTAQYAFFATGNTSSSSRGLLENCVLKQDTNFKAMRFLTGPTGLGYYRAVNNTTVTDSYWEFESRGAPLDVELINNLNLGPGVFVNLSGGGSVIQSGSNNYSTSSRPWPVALQGSPYPITPSTAYDPGAGDFALYVGKNGALLDSPNNDVIDGGVGPASNSDVPTTDILGNTRSGTTTNPGAFALAQATAVLTRTIGPVGRDFATFTLAEADVETIGGSADLVFENERIEFLADAGTYNEYVIINSTLTTDATRQVTYKPASGSEHGGVFGAGVHIQSAGRLITFEDSYTALLGLSLESTSSHVVRAEPGAVDAKYGGLIDGCMIETVNNQSGLYLSRVGWGSASNPLVMQNCSLRRARLNIFAQSTNASSSEAHTRITNCTVWSDASGYLYYPFAGAGNTLNLNVTNVLLMPRPGSADARNADNSETTGTLVVSGTNNFAQGAAMAADKTFGAAQRGSPYPITPTTSFSTPLSSGDFAVYMGATGALANKTGNDVWQQGVGPGANASVPTTDINGVARSGATCNPGAFEADGFVAPAVTTQTIGPVGRDYATFTLAEASLPAEDITFTNRAFVFEADAATYSGTLNADSNLTTDGTRNVTYRPAAGSTHGGVAGAGVIIDTGGANRPITLIDDFTVVDGFNLVTTTNYCAWLQGAGGVARNCIASPAVRGFLVYGGTAVHPVEVLNCVALGGTGHGFYNLADSSGDAHGKYVNCVGNSSGQTVYRNQQNANTSSAAYLNCLSLSSLTYDGSGGGTATGSNNFGGSNSPFPAAIQAGSQTWTFTTDTDETTSPSTGSQVVYDATTGALINSPNNDAVGVGTTTGAPTTDINGEERIRGIYADPGAFTTELVTLNRTIGPVGRDYATFTAAEADVTNIPTDPNLQQRNEAIVFEADAGTYSESVIIDNALTCDPTRNVTFQSATFDIAHIETDAFFGVVQIRDGAFTTLRRLKVTNTNTGAACRGVEIIPASGDSCEGCTLDGLTSTGANSANFTAFEVELNTSAAAGGAGSAAHPSVIQNCVALGTGTGIGIVGGATGEIHARIVNCTLAGTGLAAISIQTPSDVTVEVVNTINLSHTQTFRTLFTTGALTTSGSNNFGNTTQPFPAALQGSPYPITATTSFSTPLGSGDYAVYMGATGALADVTGNDVWQQGVGPGTNASVPTTDINGVARSGATCNPGAFEADGFVAPTVITRTVGTASRDYATLILAEAAAETLAGTTDFCTANVAVLFSVHADSTFTSGAALNISNSANICDATRNVTYQRATSERPLRVYTGGDTNVAIKNGYTIWDGIDIESATGQGIRLSAEVGSTDLNRVIVRNCVIACGGSGQLKISTPMQKTSATIGFGSPQEPCRVENVVSRSRTAISQYAPNLAHTSGMHVEVVNCTHLGDGFNVHPAWNWAVYNGLPDASFKIINCANLARNTTSDANITGGGVDISGSTNNIGNAAGSNPSFHFANIGGGIGAQYTTTTDPLAASTGSQVIYDASTGAMVNAPGNDAVGVGTTTGAPTTDINGEERIRDTHADPGAFTTQLRTITKSIDGSGSGDYTTFTAAEAAVTSVATDVDMVKRNEAIVFEAEAGTYTESVTFSSTLTTDATRQVTYKPAAGSEHGGVFGGGAFIDGTGYATIWCQSSERYTRFDSLSVRGSGMAVLAAADGVIVSSCMLESTGSTGVQLSDAGSPAAPITLQNSVAKGASGNIIFCRHSATDTYCRVTNCTVLGAGTAVRAGAYSAGVVLDIELVNVVALHSGQVYVPTSTGLLAVTGSNNFGGATNPFPAALQAGSQTWTFTTDTAAASTGSQVIYDATTGALINSPNNDAVGAGTSTGAPTTDINGEERIRDTHVDPGAFVAPLRTITKTIDGSGSGDYTTFTAAEAAVTSVATDADMVKRNETIVFEAEAGTYSESPFFSSSLTTDATRQVTYKPAAGSEHGGDPASGVILQGQINIADTEQYLLFDGLVSKQPTGRTAPCVEIGGDGHVIRSCVIVQAGDRTAVRIGLVRDAGQLSPNVIENCVIDTTASGSRSCIETFGRTGGTFTHIVNCTGTAHVNKPFIESAYVGVTTKILNCLSLGTRSYTESNPATLTGSNNFGGSSDPFPAALQAGSQTWTVTTDTDETTSPSTGSQVVYDSSTGALVNSTNNDAVGGGTATGAPTTDINGQDRIRDTFADPGAFTVELLTLTKSINGYGTGDYATFTAAEAATPTFLPSDNLIQRNTAIVFEAEYGTYSERVNVSSSLTADATRNVTYKAAAGSEHGGDSAQGVRILDSQQGTLFTADDDFTALDGLVLSLDGAGGSDTTLVLAGQGTAARNLILDLTGRGASGGVATKLSGASTTDVIVENCVGLGVYIFLQRLGNSTGGAQLRNNTATTRTGGNSYFILNESTTAGTVACDNNIFIPTAAGSHRWLLDSPGAVNLTGSASNVHQSTDPPPLALQALSQTWTFSTDPADTSTGSQVIYDATTGALVNIPGNDAVGVCGVTGIPATDIRGEDRIRDTHADPGAFTTQLRTITKSIDAAGGGDYTTFTAAEAAVSTLPTDADMVKRNEAIVFEADAGTYAESGTVYLLSSLTTDATRQVTYKAAAGSEHGGSESAGVIVQPATGSTPFFPYDNFAALDGLVLKGTATNANGVQTGSSAADGVLMRNLVIVAGAYPLTLYGGGSASNPMRVENCVARSTGNVDVVRALGLNRAVYVDLINCTVRDGRTSISVSAVNHDATVHLVNILALDPSSNTYVAGTGAGTLTVTGSNNFGGSTNPFPVALQGSPYPITATTNTSPGAGDWAIYDATTGALVNVPDNSVIGAGTATGAPTTDINGDYRIRTEFTDPGAFRSDRVVVTRSVDPSDSGDYATVISAEADVANLVTTSNLAQRNEAVVFQLATGYFDEDVLCVGNFVFGPENNVTFEAAPGSLHESRGNRGSKVKKIISSSTHPYLKVSGLVLDYFTVQNVGSGHPGGLVIDGCVLNNSLSLRGNAPYQSNIVRNCLFLSGTTTNENLAITPDSTTTDVLIQYNTFANSESRHVIANGSSGRAEVTLVGNLFVGSGATVRNFAINDATYTLKGRNNVGYDTYIPYDLLLGNQTWVVTTDLSLPSTGNQVIYYDISYRLYDVPGNDAWRAISDLTDAPLLDIDGVSRQASLVNPGTSQTFASVIVTGALSHAAASLASAGTSTFFVRAALSGPGVTTVHPFTNDTATARSVFYSTAELSARAAGTSGTVYWYIDSSGSLNIRPVLSSSAISVFAATAELNTGAFGGIVEGRWFIDANANLTQPWGGEIRDDGLVRGTGTFLSASVRLHGLDSAVQLPLYRAFLSGTLSRVGMAAKVDTSAPPNQVAIKVGKAGIAGQGGMIDIPNHSRGSGVVIT